MLGSDRLRTLLAGLARERRAPAPVAAPADEAHDARSERAPDGAPVAAPGANGARERRAAPVSTPLGIEAFLPGGEWRDARGAVYVHERLRSEMERPALHWGCLEAPSEDEEELLALVESGIGRAYNVSLASLPNFTLPGDLSPSARYWDRDIVTPEWTMDVKGMVSVPRDKPGIGVTVDRDRIDNITVREEELRTPRT